MERKHEIFTNFTCLFDHLELSWTSFACFHSLIILLFRYYPLLSSNYILSLYFLPFYDLWLMAAKRQKLHLRKYG
ncbi:hypothetical protein RJT34_30330 [Clitoria ternatea]|uniref:Uncharacterized protein n=1 Tax=Clitoria ternatea TaxID=43366 RepID=A0AAN9I3Y4_CLITE